MKLEGRNTRWLTADFRSGEGLAALDLPTAEGTSAAASAPAGFCPGASPDLRWSCCD